MAVGGREGTEAILLACTQRRRSPQADIHRAEHLFGCIDVVVRPDRVSGTNASDPSASAPVVSRLAHAAS
jgi:hypothetical protein